MRIDSHQHFWKVARGDYGWLNVQDHPAIFRDYLPGDLLPFLRDGQIDATVLVQAAPSVAETDFLLGLGAQTPFIAGVIGWVDFDDANAVDRIEALAKHDKLIGLRPMIQDIEDDRWMLKSHLARVLHRMSALDLAFDALVKPRHLPALAEFLARYPELRVVIDHAAKPDIARDDLSSWATGVRVIARRTGACCKLSGLVTTAGRAWTAEKLQPFVDVLLEAFGAERLMWGSDWPVVNEACSYSRWLEAAETLTRCVSALDRQRIFGDTATAFYRL